MGFCNCTISWTYKSAVIIYPSHFIAVGHWELIFSNCESVYWIAENVPTHLNTWFRHPYINWYVALTVYCQFSDFVPFKMLVAEYSFHFHLLISPLGCVSRTPQLLVRLKTWFIFKVVQWLNCFDFAYLKRSCCWCCGWRSEGVSDLQC